jgi:7-cyano-7-deazaguanine synthase
LRRRRKPKVRVKRKARNKNRTYSFILKEKANIQSGYLPFLFDGGFMRTVVSLSGGMDSTTLLGIVISELENYGTKLSELLTVSFKYDSKHNIYELLAAQSIAKYYGVKWLVVDVRKCFQYTQSDLLKSGGNIPEGHYAENSMKATVVPGRNLIFASILASIAESVKASEIALAVHSGDHHIYPDCRPYFIENLNKTIMESTQGMVSVYTPFLNSPKDTILRYGLDIGGVPYELTRTCYKDQPVACGKCGSCNERLEAFKLNGVIDPIEYEE